MKEQTNCTKCRSYGALAEPQPAGGAYVYGFCFKTFHEGYGSAYPVYLPESEACKNFTLKSENADQDEARGDEQEQ